MSSWRYTNMHFCVQRIHTVCTIWNVSITTYFFCVRVSQEKRSAFPRFYFIGDDDLLEILGQATNPTVIQSHLKKLFAGQFCSILFSFMSYFALFSSPLYLVFFVSEHILLDSEGSLCVYYLCRHPQCCV